MISLEELILEFPSIYPKCSQKPRRIVDKNNNVFGYVNRFYPNAFQKWFSYTIGEGFFVNVNVKDSSENQRLQIIEKPSLSLNTKWNGYVYPSSEPFIINTPSIVSVGRKLEVLYKGRLITVKDTTFGTEPKLYDENGKLLVRCKDPLLGEKIKIQILDDILDPYQVIGICFLHSFA